MLNCLVISNFAPHFRKLILFNTDMAAALKRKARRIKTRARIRKQIIKIQGFKPVIKSIDIEAIKEEFKRNISKTISTKEGVSEKTEDKEAVEAMKETVAEKEKETKTAANASEVVKDEQAEAVKEKKGAARKPAVKAPKADTTETAKEKKTASKKPAAKAKTTDADKAKKKDVTKKK